MSNSALKAKWAALPPKTRLVITLVTTAVVLIAIAAALGVGGKRRTVSKLDAPSVSNMTMPSRREGSVEAVAGRVDAAQEQLKALKNDLTRSQEMNQVLMRRLDELSQAAERNGATADMGKELLSLASRIDAIERAKQEKRAASKLDDPLPGAEAASPAVAAAPERVREEPSLQVVSRTAPAEKPKVQGAVRPEKKIPYLSPGSFFEVELLNGMDAPTSSVTQKNPVPTLLRVKTEAILPNKYRHDVRECFAIASGYGVLATERVNLRTESFSCIKEDGSAIEGKMDGYVVGEDGKVGMRGRLVSKQGQLIAKSITAGFLSGAARSLSPTSIPQLNLNPGTNNQAQTTPFGTAMEAGTYQGLADTSRMIAKFYLDMAKEMFPVIEVDAARRATIVLIKGIELKE